MPWGFGGLLGFWRVGGVFMGGKGRSKDGDGRGEGTQKGTPASREGLYVLCMTMFCGCFVYDNVLRAVLLCFAGFAAVLCWLTPTIGSRRLELELAAHRSPGDLSTGDR